MEQAINREPIHSDTETMLTPAVDLRAYRAGVIAGVLSFIAFLGVVKGLNALLDPGGRGEVAWGFLMIRYSSLQRYGSVIGLPAMPPGWPRFLISCCMPRLCMD